MKLHLDTEVYSEVNLKDAGVYRYAEHESTELLVACYAFDDGPVTVWIPYAPVSAWIVISNMLKERLQGNDKIIVGLSAPDDILNHIEAGGEVWAHNAQFERVVLNGTAGRKLDFPHIKIEQTRCTAAKMRVHGLPAALEDAASALGTAAKDLTGKGVMLQLCRPRSGEVKRYSPEEFPEKYVQLFSYCADDVRAERGIDNAVPDLTPNEQRIYELDQRANDRGILVDTKMIADVQFLIDQYKAEMEALCREWTGVKPTQREKIAEWVRTNGYPQLPDMTADTVRKCVKDPDCPEPVKNVLKLYSTYGMKAVSKYPRMLEAMCADKRLRGMFLHYGAGPGRWSSFIVQLQNLFRPVIKDTDVAIEAMKARDLDWIRMLYTVDPMKVFASCVRGALVAAPGHDILAIDYSGIESRLTAWIFNEVWKLAAFRAQDAKTGPDTYKLAYSRLFLVPVEDVKDWQRQIGKVLELSMGFEGGVMAFTTMAATYNMDLNKLADVVYPILPQDVKESAEWIWRLVESKGRTGGLSEKVYVSCEGLKKLWRAAHPAHVAGWKNMRDAAIAAVRNPGTAYALPSKLIAFKMVDQWLYMRLPSGRKIAYYKPEVVQPKPIKLENGKEKIPDPVLYYWGVDTETRRWQRVATYGGRLTQNFAEGIARDLLVNGLQNLEAADYPPIGSVHDEGLFEPAETHGSFEEAKKLFLTAPKWSAGLPLNAAGFRSKRYRK